MDQIGANTLKMLPNMIKICKQKTVKTAIKKLTDTLEKKKCQQSELKCTKVPSDRNKQRN